MPERSVQVIEQNGSLLLTRTVRHHGFGKSESVDLTVHNLGPGHAFLSHWSFTRHSVVMRHESSRMIPPGGLHRLIEVDSLAYLQEVAKEEKLKGYFDTSGDVFEVKIHVFIESKEVTFCQRVSWLWDSTETKLYLPDAQEK